MFLLVLFAFVAGVVTILSPCILPLLPIILAGSSSGGKSKPLGIVVGFVTSFTVFTLFLSALVRIAHIPADALRTTSIVILILFGISLLIPKIQTLLEILFSKLLPSGSNSSSQTGFFGGFVLGLGIGVLWTPCVGPILASVIALAAAGTVNGSTILITLAYSLGTAIPMFAVIVAGRKLVQKIPRPDLIQKIFGVVMVLTALAIFFNLDRKFQTWVTAAFPSYGTGLTSFESIVTSKSSALSSAPELISGGMWFNSDPLTIASLKGKVVLIDFWTYTCINCIRTLPYLKAWNTKYRDKGLVIIGVHSPEFEFEKDSANVKQAISDFGITYPVMQDNNLATWHAFKNEYWPAEYLIDKTGKIIHTHFGEGEYDQSEAAIQSALSVSMPISNSTYSINAQTPELYIGSARYESGYIQFQGQWSDQSEYSVPSPGASLTLDFSAQNAYIVLKPTDPTIATMQIYLDDKLTSTAVVDTSKLYTLAKYSQSGTHHLKLVFPQGGLQAYSFTFG